ncbi:ATP-dependent metallopeptidase FtsH/Yme1/Tma family protein [Clostridium amazonitimonense]|uniref:ATP-dependent metallopeptidase FtsH/Yme1/Tma family protein n=1 Tax=Clostridium amazonitimonense TaxID=1499689 RepID=UPI0005097B26|nr:FtsH/Yme1/Tma family ATP-dependent metallopeptidase [Clostridium amazonitimonense]
MNKLKKKYLLIPVLIAVLSLIYLIIVNKTIKVNNYKDYSQFVTDMNNNTIDKVYLSAQDSMKIKLKDGTEYFTDNPRSVTLKEDLLKVGAKVLEKDDLSLSQLIPSLLLGFSSLILLSYFVKSVATSGRGLKSVDSLDAKAATDVKWDFNIMAGNEEAKESVMDIVDYLKNPEKYSKYGARMPKGIILYGEPGTGKTLLAKAVAGEANVPFYAMSGSDFVQVYVGVGASRIRSLFKKAKSHGKAVIFIDEIDAIGKKRDSSKAGGSDERDQTLNALLTEMSGFNEHHGIIVMAATNRLDMLDSALLRPGRFDRHIEITLPDVKAREDILNLHFKNKPYKNINIKDWAKNTSLFSGAKLENLVNESAILACREGSEFITHEHLDKAFSIVLAGYEKVNKDFLDEKSKSITAYHEIGHALVTKKLFPKEKISKVTIIPTTKGAGGYTLSIPEDTSYESLTYLKNKIMVFLGGRAAEEIIFGKEHITTGAYNDLKQCTTLMTNMLTEYGMGNSLGLLNLSSIQERFNVSTSDITMECKELLNDLYEKTKDLLIENLDELNTLSEKLLEKETLYTKDLL